MGVRLANVTFKGVSIFYCAYFWVPIRQKLEIIISEIYSKFMIRLQANCAVLKLRFELDFYIYL